jgi:hypothetical protein
VMVQGIPTKERITSLRIQQKDIFISVHQICKSVIQTLLQ